MTSVLIVGSGPAAAGAALACARREGVRVTVLDIGRQLEPDREDARARLEAAPPEDWSRDDLDAVRARPIPSRTKGPPQKRAYGSDYSFRDVGQLQGIAGDGRTNDEVVSAAYGGFSSVWGAQVMPFTSATFRTWPVSAAEMHEHYRAVLEAIPYAAEEDDLAERFPLLGPSRSLPRPAERTEAVLGRYARHRGRLGRRGLVLGRARLAFDADACVLAGLCMTGCPYRLVYSSAHTFDRLRSEGAVDYRPGFLAVRVEERGEEAVVVARELASGAVREFRADRVLLAAGAFGTTRLIAGSLGMDGRELRMQESLQFLLPFGSLAPTPTDPRSRSDFTLNQFNLAVDLDREGYDLVHLHFYTYDPAFLDRLPALLGSGRGGPLTSQALRRLSVAFGYLPSWRSPGLSVRVGKPVSRDALPPLTLSGARLRPLRSPVLRTVLRRLVYAAPFVDLWPLLPLLRVSAPGKSYHFGGSFPHGSGSDALGRVGSWRRIHAVDGSVLPSIAATTFTLTVMANAHRIADSALRAR